MSKEFSVRVEEKDRGKRLDSFLAEQFAELTRNAIQLLIADGGVSCEGALLKKNYRVNGDEIIAVAIPDAQTTAIVPENIPIHIV